MSNGALSQHARRETHMELRAQGQLNKGSLANPRTPKTPQELIAEAARARAAN